MIKDQFTVLILTLIQRMEPGACEMPEPRGRLPYKSDKDAHWKIQIKPLRETKTHPRSGFWKVFFNSGTCFGFREVFLDSGKCFGFWEVFLDSGKCFWILGSVLDSGTCFLILGSVLDSGKCFWILGLVLSLRATV